MPRNGSIDFDNGVDLSVEGPSDFKDDDPFHAYNFLTYKERLKYYDFLHNPTLDQWLYYVNIFLAYPTEFFVKVDMSDSNEIFEVSLHDVIRGLFDILRRRDAVYISSDYDTLKKSKLVKLAMRVQLNRGLLLLID